MIAKLIAHGADRDEAIDRPGRTRSRQVEVWPVKTNAGFLARASADPDFRAGDVDTGFIPRGIDDGWCPAGAGRRRLARWPRARSAGLPSFGDGRRAGDALGGAAGLPAQRAARSRRAR